MSWSEHLVQDQRRRTDCAIHHAYVQLAFDPSVLKHFHEMLHIARKRAPRLFEAPAINGRHLGITALVNLARFHGSHLRPVIDWAGSPSSWRVVVASLAHHLVCQYEVPFFLAASWYATEPSADRKRNWFVAHSRGASFRSLHLPVVMTRKMEHIFLASQDHLSIEHAIRRAELVSLGTPPAFLKAILSTRLATDLCHGEFWRTVWAFLIANADEVSPTQIGPLIDYIQAVRHDRIPVETPDGIVELDPPQPAFSMKGRTVASVMRLMQVWHRSLGASGPALSWVRSPIQPLVMADASPDHSEKPKRWHLLELTDSAQLRNEGTALRHCVASYAYRCHRGVSSIWSLRVWQGEKLRHVLTVEVDPKRRAIVQARGRVNRAASGKSLELIQHWALREKLTMAI